MWRLIYVNVFVLLLASTLLADDDGAINIVPNKKLHGQIQHVLNVAYDRSIPDSQQFAEMFKLAEAMSGQEEELIRQCLLFSSVQSDERFRIGALVMIDRFHFSSRIEKQAAAGLVDGPNARVRTQAGTLLDRVDTQPDMRRPDFSYYADLIRQRDGKGSTALVGYMFRRSPGDALLALGRVFEMKSDKRLPLHWAVFVLSKALYSKRGGNTDDSVNAGAAAELEKLSQHEAWWARLYVAEIVSQFPEYGAESLVARLRSDSHEMVKAAANRKK